MAKEKSGVTTVGAMRAALQANGDDAANAVLLSWIKTNFPTVSVKEEYISQLKNAARKGMNGRKRRRKKRKAAVVAPVATGETVDLSKQITVADIAAVKALVDKIGADKTRRLAEVFAR
jgi:hypothetical protein